MKQTEVQADSVRQERSNIMYKVNPGSYSSVFVLPTQIADKHLRMAGKAQLKVLLWLYRNPNEAFDLAVISRDTGIPTDEIDDAMLYWIEAGIVIKDGEMPVVIREESKHEKAVFVPAEKPLVKEENLGKKEKCTVHTVKPSIKDIARRLDESNEVAMMFNEVQEVFGRTLGYDGQSNLLVLYDHYGLPAEVIVMLCSYAKTVGKQGAIAYIMQMGKSWAEEGITDFDSASRKIGRLENAQKIWNQFRQLTGFENPKPTSKQSQFLELWINDYLYDIDIIYFAYEKTVEKKGKISFSYMNGILRSWHESGYKTIDEIERGSEEFAKGTAISKAEPDGGKKPSYDIDLAIKRSLAIDPTKTKKGQ